MEIKEQPVVASGGSTAPRQGAAIKEHAIVGSIPEVVRNDARLYEGNLVKYFQIVFREAHNLSRPYHNFRHMFHVTWECHEACKFYRRTLNRRQMRNLLIAAMFHDFDHSGTLVDDELNIERAIAGVTKHIAAEDWNYLANIVQLIQATEFPYRIPPDQLDLCGEILRDADLSQALSATWIQQVVFGFAVEWGKEPISVLKSQPSFLSNLTLHTEWARQRFPKSVIDAKIEEARNLFELLDGK